ncbi:branched-chain amino acid ABC transporter permease [Sporichthya sp.]|uniref:branched-chain amino acid ABC transporter permease n=1 Tax=Sporichthya sp. TaxID=65475 RepID=UPI0025D9354C|nr:branched-chain amino acid ABC transporter permease [Sporichthya sp.]
MARRLAGALAALVLALLAIPFLASPAAAEGEDLHGKLRNGDTAVADVRIFATDAGGTQIGETRSDAEGVWAIPLPGPGKYTVTLDAETLPEGVALRNADNASVTREILGGAETPQLFPLGEGRAVAKQDTIEWVQLTAEGLRFGLIIALAAVGLSLIYGTTGLVNFSHGELVTLGAMIAYWFNVEHGLQLIAAGALAVAVCGAAGGAQDALFWGVLRKRKTGLLAMMIISIGLALLVRYIYQYLFGGGNEAFTDYNSQTAVKPAGLPFALAPKDYWSMGIAAAALVLVLLALNMTRLGKATRAVADNPSLAAASGIDVDRVIRLVWAVGAALAGLAGVLLGLAQQVNFAMGFNILLLLFAAVTLGGLGSAAGALLGSLVIGLFIQLSTLWVSPELKNVGALGVLIVILLVRPQGILGRAERIG